MQAVHEKGRPFRFNAGGYSMAPFIRNGDVICVSSLNSCDPGPGDVVAFIHPDTGSPCIHRVLSVRNGRFFIQGDNMPEKPDGMVPREAIFGRVTRVERAGRRISLGLGPERRLIALLSRCGGLALVRRFGGPLYARLSQRAWHNR